MERRPCQWMRVCAGVGLRVAGGGEEGGRPGRDDEAALGEGPGEAGGGQQRHPCCGRGSRRSRIAAAASCRPSWRARVIWRCRASSRPSSRQRGQRTSSRRRAQAAMMRCTASKEAATGVSKAGGRKATPPVGVDARRVAIGRSPKAQGRDHQELGGPQRRHRGALRIIRFAHGPRRLPMHPGERLAAAGCKCKSLSFSSSPRAGA